MNECLELHYNISDVIGAIVRTHGSDYMEIYLKDWNPIVTDLSRSYCAKEDRQFALYIISDILEFVITNDTAEAFLATFIPALLETTGECSAVGPRQAAAYSLGIAAEKFPTIFSPFAYVSIGALSKSIKLGEEGELRGPCTDNSASAVGIILENMGNLGLELQYDFLWDQWIAYLPLLHDLVSFLVTFIPQIM